MSAFKAGLVHSARERRLGDLDGFGYGDFSWGPRKSAPSASTVQWTPEREALCRRLWAEGLSARAIADRLGGITRNAIVGKMYRFRMEALGRGDKASADTMRRATADGARIYGREWRKRRKPRKVAPPNGAHHVRQDHERIAALEAIKAERIEAQAGPDLDVPENERLSLIGLPDDNCKWPFGDGPFYFHKCRRVPGSPYCEFHAKRAIDARQPGSGRVSAMPRIKTHASSAIVSAAFDSMERV